MMYRTDMVPYKKKRSIESSQNLKVLTNFDSQIKTK